MVLRSTGSPVAGSADHYHAVMRCLHWIMALGVFIMYALGTFMDEVPEGNARDFLVRFHVSVGITLIALLAARVAARWSTHTPEWPVEMSTRERLYARLGHGALYGVIALVLATGWLEAEVSAYGTAWFGQRISGFVPESGLIVDLSAVRVLDELHMFLADLLMVLVAGHVGFVIKHEWFDRRDVLGRMFRGYRGLRRGTARRGARGRRGEEPS